MRARKFASLAGAVAIVLASADGWRASANETAAASDVPDQLAWVNQGADWTTDERRKLEHFTALIVTGQLDELEQAMNDYPLQGKYAEQRTRFFTGAILRRRGKLKEAAEIYREILAQNPELEKVRAELVILWCWAIQIA